MSEKRERAERIVEAVNAILAEHSCFPLCADERAGLLHLLARELPDPADLARLREALRRIEIIAAEDLSWVTDPDVCSNLRAIQKQARTALAAQKEPADG